MSDPVISVRHLSKAYQLGTIGRHTLVDECQYLWHRLRGRDPRQHMGVIGHSATEARRVTAEQERQAIFWALKDVAFDVHAGEVLGIIGRNGAGKSTLLKILSRITEPTGGEVDIEGRVGSLLEVGTGFHPELTGRENIFMNGTILGMKKREIAARLDEIVAFSEIEKFIDTPVKRYSSGMYIRLAFAVAAHLQRDVLLVDEVLAVGDIAFQRKCMGKMSELATAGRAILFVSHQMNAVRRLCSRCLLFDGGRIRLDGTPSEVVSTYESSRNDAAPGDGEREAGATAKQAAALYAGWSIVSPRGGSPHALSGLGEVVFEARVRVRRPIVHGHCGLTLRDDNRQVLCSWVRHGFALEAGTAALRFTFPTLPLRAGLYHWLISLYADRDLIDLWDAVPPLRIDTPPQDDARDEWAGILNLPSRFEIVNAGPFPAPDAAAPGSPGKETPHDA